MLQTARREIQTSEGVTKWSRELRATMAAALKPLVPDDDIDDDDDDDDDDIYTVHDDDDSDNTD